ncbi:hypothetical protein CR513_20494, partial [Mucuna pruriens]
MITLEGWRWFTNDSRDVEDRVYQSMKRLGNGIHGEQDFGFHIPCSMMSLKDTFALMPRDPLPCANGFLPKAFIIFLHTIFKSFELYGILMHAKGHYKLIPNASFTLNGLSFTCVHD